MGSRTRGALSIVVDVLATAVDVEAIVAEVVAPPSEPVNVAGRPHAPSKTTKTNTAIDEADLTGAVSDFDLADVRRNMLS